MTWRIDYSRDSLEFINKHALQDKVREELRKFLVVIHKGQAPINLKKLEGKWTGYYRLRKGKIRIIFYINKSEKVLYVERVDFRGNVYR